MDELLVQAALELVNARYPKGWGRCGAQDEKRDNSHQRLP